ncbi:MAG: hypothetical protein EOO57_10015, partial [Hymenobacter sp.]
MPRKYLALALAALASCQSPTTAESDTTAKTPAAPARYHEVHRPQFHFSPQENWMNDPNGLVYE